MLSAIMCDASMIHMSLMHVMCHSSSSSGIHLFTRLFMTIRSIQFAMQVMSRE